MSLIKSTFISRHNIALASVSILMKCCHLQMRMESKCINFKTAQIFPQFSYILHPFPFPLIRKKIKLLKEKTTNCFLSPAFNVDGCEPTVYTGISANPHLRIGDYS